MNTDQWASHDQLTSFAKVPWGFSRPENRKEHSVLSKARFAEWPNTTSDFALHRGVAPTEKLATGHTSRFGNLQGAEMTSSASPSEVTTKTSSTKQPSFAISDAQLRASVDTTVSRPAGDFALRATATAEELPLPTQRDRVAARNSADDVTAAHTLLQQHATERESPSSRQNQEQCSAPTTFSASQAGVALSTLAERNDRKAGQRTSLGEHRENHRAVPSNWSVTNIGFNNIKSEAQARIERENKDGYARAAFASQDADKSYLAEAAHFRFRYPHTLGRIAALSHVRIDRINARKDRVGAANNRKHHE